MSRPRPLTPRMAAVLDAIRAGEVSGYRTWGGSTVWCLGAGVVTTQVRALVERGHVRIVPPREFGHPSTLLLVEPGS